MLCLTVVLLGHFGLDFTKILGLRHLLGVFTNFFSEMIETISNQ